MLQSPNLLPLGPHVLKASPPPNSITIYQPSLEHMVCQEILKMQTLPMTLSYWHFHSSTHVPRYQMCFIPVPRYSSFLLTAAITLLLANHFFNFLIFFIQCLYMYAHTSVHMSVCVHAYEDQRITSETQFSHSTLWVLRIQFRSPG